MHPNRTSISKTTWKKTIVEANCIRQYVWSIFTCYIQILLRCNSCYWSIDVSCTCLNSLLTTSGDVICQCTSTRTSMGGIGKAAETFQTRGLAAAGGASTSAILKNDGVKHGQTLDIKSNDQFRFQVADFWKGRIASRCGRAVHQHLSSNNLYRNTSSARTCFTLNVSELWSSLEGLSGYPYQKKGTTMASHSAAAWAQWLVDQIDQTGAVHHETWIKGSCRGADWSRKKETNKQWCI